jgi:hypothetical protein
MRIAHQVRWTGAPAETVRVERKERRMAKAIGLVLLPAAILCAQEKGGLTGPSRGMPAEPKTALSRFSAVDRMPSADPDEPFWKGAPYVIATRSSLGPVVPGHRTEIRSRWTNKNLYFLFVCAYERLHLKPNPSRDRETNHLWEWDVAEVFIGSDYRNTHRYKEFEISPQEEWLDLDIDADHRLPERDALWNSGFQVKARIDSEHKVWYGEMVIPIAAVDSRLPEPGREMRINFYRAQGPPGPEHVSIAWQPTRSVTYHVPEAFGTLRLAGK